MLGLSGSGTRYRSPLLSLFLSLAFSVSLGASISPSHFVTQPEELTTSTREIRALFGRRNVAYPMPVGRSDNKSRQYRRLHRDVSGF